MFGLRLKFNFIIKNIKLMFFSCLLKNAKKKNE
jgi:hypothetical protein